MIAKLLTLNFLPIDSWDLFARNTTQGQVKISPLIIDLQANCGESKSTINVTNNSDKPFRARVYAQPFTYDRNTGFKTVYSSPNDLTPYLQFSPQKLTIPPRATKKVRLIARFPANLTPGEYRAVIFIEKIEESKDSNGNKLNIATRIGATVYARKGNLSSNLAVDSAKWNQQQQLIKLLVKNTDQASAK